jgi:hypothetical protein
MGMESGLDNYSRRVNHIGLELLSNGRPSAVKSWVAAGALKES